MNEQRQPLVTICMTTKNRAWCLPRVIQAIAQTSYPRTQIRLVIVDDYSEDGSWEILKEWESQHKGLFREIILLREHTNIPEARNLGLANAEGTYILFWDSDVVPPSEGFLGQLVEIMDSDADIGAVGCSYIYEDPKSGRKFDKPPVSRKTHAVYLGFTLVNSEAAREVGGFNEDMNVGEDTEYFIRMSEKTHHKIIWAPKPVLHLRKPGAITTSPGGFVKLIKFTYRERAKGYRKQFSVLPRFLRVRVAYYLSLPLFWVGLVLLALFGLLNVWIALGLFVCGVLPALGSAVRNLGFRSGVVTAFTFYIPTGIALAYGILAESVRVRRGNPAQ